MFRRVGRYLRTLFALATVLLFLAVAGLWIRSYWRGDEIHLTSRKALPQPGPMRDHTLLRELFLVSGKGGICVAARDLECKDQGPARISPWQTSQNPDYPQPWSRAATLTLGSLNRITGITSTTSPTNPLTITSSSLSLTLAPTTRPSTGGSSWAGATTGPSVASFSIASGTLSNAFTVTASSSGGGGTIVLNGSGAINVTTAGGGSIPKTVGSVQNVTFSGGTLMLSSIQWSLPLPAPKNPPPQGFRFVAYRAGVPTDSLGRAYVMVFPYWSLMIALGLLMLQAVRSESRARLRRWRLRNGLCITCGYDLRASTDRCPECGAGVVRAVQPV